MTDGVTPGSVGSLGRRILASFVIVTLGALTLLTVAALFATERGISAATTGEARRAAQDAARAAASAYAQANGDWAQADLARPRQIAVAAGARLVLVDAQGRPVQGLAGGPGLASRPSGERTDALVVVNGEAVGTLTLGFGPGARGQAAGRTVAWTWITVAALTAVALSVIAAWALTRSLTRPLLQLRDGVRAFAAGDRTVRVGELGQGEIAEVARSFDDAAEAVDRVETTRRRLAADIAHELRTPLAALQAGLEELRDGLVPADAETMARLHSQVLRLARTVEELSQLSSAEALGPTLHLAPVEVSVLVDEEVAARRPQLDAAEVSVSTDITPGLEVPADEHRLRQVVGNLLANCARHCRPGDHVEVVLSLRTAASDPQAPMEGVVRLTVSDNGPGISPQDLPHVFERFWRGTNRSNNGSGLGLAIARAVVHAHGGTITADSDGQHGTTLTVDLPGARRRPSPHGGTPLSAIRPDA